MDDHDINADPNKSEIKNNSIKSREIEMKCSQTPVAEDNTTENEETKTTTIKEISFENNAIDDDVQNQVVDEAHCHYEDGICIYTDPDSKCQFVWDEKKQEWVTRKNNFTDKDYEYDGKKYSYIDKETNFKYCWDEESNEWKLADEHQTKVEQASESQENKEVENDGDKKTPNEITKQDMTQGQYSYENGTHIYTDPSDGSKYFWDKEKNAWFPKVDDDFLAQYQMSYGFVDPNEEKEEEKPPDPMPVEAKEKRKAPSVPTWFEPGEESTKVYVSGLPLDILETEFVDVMQKCGLVMRDPDNGKMKVKIYLDPETSLPKGDALCTYIKKESVDLALNLLDGSDVRGHRIKVERAKFTMKGEAYDPSLKPKKRRKKDKEKLKKSQEKLLDWRPDKMRGERSKHENTVIVKNLFDPAMFNKDVKLILEYQQDLRDECLKCGSVKKVIIYDRHSEGVAQISFKEVEAADACVQLLNGRWFGQRKITAETWDGMTKYKITETDEQIKSRLEKWQKFLETGESPNEESGEKTQLEDKSKEETQANIEGQGSVTEDKVSVADGVTRSSNDGGRDSDQDTVSSVESEYDTDDDTKTTKS